MSFALLDSLVAADAAARRVLLLETAEDQWFDRKSARIAPRDLAKTIVAMANAEGGVIVIGAHDGLIENVDGNTRAINGWRQSSFDFVVPPVRIQLDELPIADDVGGAAAVALVHVQPGEVVHATQRDEVYLRVGDEDRRLGFDQRQQLMYDKGQSSFETTPVADAALGDLDGELVDGYAEALGHPDARRLLVARGLVSDEGVVSIGALLLFGEMPQARFPHSLVRVIRYRGTERGSGERQQVLRDERIEGPLPRMLVQAREILLDVLPTRQALGSDGRFGSIGLVPEGAWLEGLVNAVVHRSYSITGDHIRVEVFDDRVEIESPGRFPGVVDLSNPERVTRFARNPRIARVCSDLRFGQELGEGVRRIFEEMRLAGLADPAYVQTAGSVRLTLVAEPFDRELDARLPTGGRELVRLVRMMDRPSTGQILAEYGEPRPTRVTIGKRLNALAKIGLIERVGNGPTDPRAYWRTRIDD